MDISRILQAVDNLYEQNKGAEAEALLREAIVLAVQEQDDAGLLQLLNELLGYYRETSQVESSYAVAAQALALAESMGLQNSIPYATTLLNIANAYRAGGRLQDSLECYLRVRSIYRKTLSPDNMLVASLENNLSLLYQEMQQFHKAKECLMRALAIVERKQADFEIAVTHANLAGTCIQLEEMQEAYEHAISAVDIFGKIGVADAHYGAALSALGTYYYKKGDYARGLSAFQKAMSIMEENLGRNEYYYRLQENAGACEQALSRGKIKGLALCREYYETYGRPMLEELFPEYLGKIAVGLVGEGSDCFGYDDAVSRDHDWGPGFCLWVTRETYDEIGKALEEAYGMLPREYKGSRRTESPMGKGRHGVMTIEAFYGRLLQATKWEDIDWHQVSDAALAAATNGQVFRDDEGIFTAWRKKLQEGYPQHIRFAKLAESGARFAQCGQYNYARMLERGDVLTADIMLADGMREAMKLAHYIAGVYPPHDKWLSRSLEQWEQGRALLALLGQLRETVLRREGHDSRRSAGSREAKAVLERGPSPDGAVQEQIEKVAVLLVSQMYEQNLISDTEPYLDAHTEELLSKSLLSLKEDERLVEDIVKLEFEAFDKVKNAGGRAECQNDWATFSVMRKSQYLTWNRTMLLQYLYDFRREYHRGHNLIEEKYGRMMESTAPEEYRKIRGHFPPLSEEKRRIIEQIVGLQVARMEEFAAVYPMLADNARSVHTAEDNLYNTSYETYLRGEISTYSDKMLELYGRYVVEYAGRQENLTFAIMENSVRLYGYDSLEAAEAWLRR